MPGAAVIGAALQTPAARPWLLHMGGDDVLYNRLASAGQRIGVPIETIALSLEGRGGVSSMTFTIEDPANTFEPAEGERVVFHDATQNITRFMGWVQSWAIVPMGVGRRIRVTAQGIEAVLDWAKVPGPLTVPAGTPPYTAAQMVLAAAIYPPGVELVALKSPFDDDGDEFGGLGRFVAFGYDTFDSVLIQDTTLRQALEAVAGACSVELLGAGQVYLDAYVTVDFLGSVRLYKTGGTPGDWTGLSVSSTPGAAAAPTNPTYENDAGGACHAVYVIGGNAAATGLVTDGRGIPGPIAQLRDTSLTTAAQRDAAAIAYMTSRTVIARAPFTLEDYSPVGNIRPGVSMTVTDAQLGLSTAAFTLEAVDVEFTPGGEFWTVSAGGMRPSAARLVRRLTRDTLS